MRRKGEVVERSGERSSGKEVSGRVRHLTRGKMKMNREMTKKEKDQKKRGKRGRGRPSAWQPLRLMNDSTY